MEGLQQEIHKNTLHWESLFNLILRYTNKPNFHWEDAIPNEINSSIVSIIQIIHIFFFKMGQMGKPCGDNVQFRDFHLLVLLLYLSIYVPEFLYKLSKFAFIRLLRLVWNEI